MTISASTNHTTFNPTPPTSDDDHIVVTSLSDTETMEGNPSAQDEKAKPPPTPVVLQTARHKEAFLVSPMHMKYL